MKEIRVTDPLYNIPIQIFTDISFSEWRERFNIGK